MKRQNSKLKIPRPKKRGMPVPKTRVSKNRRKETLRRLCRGKVDPEKY